MAEKTDLDVAQLAGRDLPKNAFPAAGKTPFRVYFEPKIHERMAAHAAEKLSLEICGILVGDWFKDENGPYVLVNEAIRADKAQSNAGDVKLTHDDWTDINREMDTKYADRKIVGWYHSHPNFGIFLSQYDIFVQQYTFNSPGQIAYVVDPVNGLEGVFCWRDGEAKSLPSFWVGDQVHLSSENKERQPSSAAATEPAPASTAGSKQDLPSPMTMLTMLLAAACIMLLGYLLGNMRTSQEREMTERGVVQYYGRIKGLRPGLREDLTIVGSQLTQIRQLAERLAVENMGLLKDEKAKEEKQKQWSDTLTAMMLVTRELEGINSTYSLSPVESEEVQKYIDEKETTYGILQPRQQPAGSETPPKPSGSGSPAKTSAAELPPKSSGDARPAKPTSEPVAPKDSAGSPPTPAQPVAPH